MLLKSFESIEFLLGPDLPGEGFAGHACKAVLEGRQEPCSKAAHVRDKCQDRPLKGGIDKSNCLERVMPQKISEHRVFMAALPTSVQGMHS